VAIPRLHLFELEDQPWFPSVIRDLATDYLCFMESKFLFHRAMVEPLAEALRITKVEQIIDLASGGGGPAKGLQKELRERLIDIRFILTDRFPNEGAFQRTTEGSAGQIVAEMEPIDARAVPPHLTGCRTLFNAFHHFKPEDAVAVLGDAVRAGQPIAVFEVSDRSLRNILPMILLTPIIILIATPFIRPLRWNRLLWTYLVPLVPITCWWDGIVSQLRAYTTDELRAMGEIAGAGSYTWNAARVPLGKTPGYLTYLIGVPNVTS
jgi:hypothetical protein